MRCFIQNQHGPLRNKWHNTGTVMEVLPYQQYAVKMDGSRKLTTRNRKFLRAYVPASVTTKSQPITTDLERGFTPFDASLPNKVDEPDILDDGSRRNISQDEGSGHVTNMTPTPDCGEVSGSLDPPTSSASKRMPRALSGLQDYNAPGRKEGMKNPRRR